jgi:hypothetical protein
MGDQWWLVFKLHPFLHSLISHSYILFLLSFFLFPSLHYFHSSPLSWWVFHVPTSQHLGPPHSLHCRHQWWPFSGPQLAIPHHFLSLHHFPAWPLLSTLIDPHNLPGQPITSHIFWHHTDLPLFCHSLKMGQIQSPETLVTNQPMLHKIPSHPILYAVLLYHISLHHGLIWPLTLEHLPPSSLYMQIKFWRSHIVFLPGKVHRPANKTVLCIGWGIFHNPEFANGHCSWLLGPAQG